MLRCGGYFATGCKISAKDHSFFAAGFFFGAAFFLTAGFLAAGFFFAGVFFLATFLPVLAARSSIRSMAWAKVRSAGSIVSGIVALIFSHFT